MINAKKEIAKIIIDSYDNQESHNDFKKTNNEINNLEELKKQLSKDLSKYNDLSCSFLEEKIAEFDAHIKELSENNLSLTEDKLKVRNSALVDKYMDMSKKHKIKDVVFDFNSTYPGGTKTFKDIIKKLNNDGAEIEYLYEKHTGRNTKDPFGGSDTHLVVTMPASSYAEFNKEIHKDQENSRFDVIGERRDYFLVPHLNQEITLDEMKEEVESSIKKEGYSRHAFNKKLSMGYVEINGSNYLSEKKIHNAINIYFSQIRAMELDGFRDGINHSISENIMTSAYQYNKNIENEELAGKPLTPLKEAKRFLPETNKLKAESKRKLKNN